MCDRATEKYSPESPPKVLVENRINYLDIKVRFVSGVRRKINISIACMNNEDVVNTYRIESGVDVAKPECKGEAPRLNVARLADGSQQVEEEERQPARYESAHDEAEDECGALLPLTADPTPLPGWILLTDHYASSINHLY